MTLAHFPALRAATVLQAIPCHDPYPDAGSCPDPQCTPRLSVCAMSRHKWHCMTCTKPRPPLTGAIIDELCMVSIAAEQQSVLSGAGIVQRFDPHWSVVMLLQVTCFSKTDIVPRGVPLPALRSLTLAASLHETQSNPYWPDKLLAPRLTSLAMSFGDPSLPERLNVHYLNSGLKWLPQLPALQVRHYGNLWHEALAYGHALC